MQLTTIGPALEQYPGLMLCRSRPVFWVRWLTRLAPWMVRGRGLIPYFFHRTMGVRDERRPMMDHGLGVIVDGNARYYPLSTLRGKEVTDDWNGRVLRHRISEDDHLPAAVWEDGSRPFQIFTRWYGFSFTYPGCEIHCEDS